MVADKSGKVAYDRRRAQANKAPLASASEFSGTESRMLCGPLRSIACSFIQKVSLSLGHNHIHTAGCSFSIFGNRAKAASTVIPYGCLPPFQFYIIIFMLVLSSFCPPRGKYLVFRGMGEAVTPFLSPPKGGEDSSS